jgi:hypothetical protein
MRGRRYPSPGTDVQLPWLAVVALVVGVAALAAVVAVVAGVAVVAVVAADPELVAVVPPEVEPPEVVAVVAVDAGAAAADVVLAWAVLRYPVRPVMPTTLSRPVRSLARLAG